MNEPAHIPLVDLWTQYVGMKEDIDRAIANVISQSSFIGGKEVQLFESEFASYCEAQACVTVGNGTDALTLALRGLGIGVGHEVVTVAHTFTATAEAIIAAGAKPVFVDIRHDTMLLDVETLRSAVTSRTKAIIAVHLYGQPCDMDGILEVAEHFNLAVIEDAAQAHGARWKGRRVGALGRVGCFSFFPGKNLGAYGDGGAIVSDDIGLIDRIRMIANHGRRDKYVHEIVGVNSRLDGMQAAVLRAKLKRLDGWNERRRAQAQRYCELLSNSSARLPIVDNRAEPVWHLFVLRCKNREKLKLALKNHGIEAGVHYPIPLHLQPAYQSLGYHAQKLPVTEEACKEVLSVPIFAELTDEQVSRIAGIVIGFPSM